MFDFSTVLNNSSPAVNNSLNGTSPWNNAVVTTERFTEGSTGRSDRTLFVSLIIMGVIVPAIFIFMFVMICIKHRQTQQSRRSTMLLRNGPEIPMDDISLTMRTNLENGRL